MQLRRRVARFIQDVLIILVTGAVIYGFDAVEVMLSSKRVYRWVLYAAFGLHGVGFLLGMYMAWIVVRTDPELERCDTLIKATTASFVSGAVLWTVAVWPVFHFWTLLLGVCFLFLTVTVVSLISIEKARRKIE
jgi:hypothetical protein